MTIIYPARLAFNLDPAKRRRCRRRPLLKQRDDLLDCHGRRKDPTFAPAAASAFFSRSRIRPVGDSGRPVRRSKRR